MWKIKSLLRWKINSWQIQKDLLWHSSKIMPKQKKMIFFQVEETLNYGKIILNIKLKLMNFLIEVFRIVSKGQRQIDWGSKHKEEKGRLRSLCRPTAKQEQAEGQFTSNMKNCTLSTSVLANRKHDFLVFFCFIKISTSSILNLFWLLSVRRFFFLFFNFLLLFLTFLSIPAWRVQYHSWRIMIINLWRGLLEGLEWCTWERGREEQVEGVRRRTLLWRFRWYRRNIQQMLYWNSWVRFDWIW